MLCEDICRVGVLSRTKKLHQISSIRPSSLHGVLQGSVYTDPGQWCAEAGQRFGKKFGTKRLQSRANITDLLCGCRTAAIKLNPGTVLGAFLSADIAPELFKILFGIILIAASIYIYSKRKIEPKSSNISKQVMILAIGSSVSV